MQSDHIDRRDGWSDYRWVLVIAALLIAVPAVALLAGAPLGPDFADERVCGKGELPAKAVESPGGSACFPEGESGSPHYVILPKGERPVKVGDRWDVYWRDKIIDADGRIVGTVDADGRVRR